MKTNRTLKGMFIVIFVNFVNAGSDCVNHEAATDYFTAKGGLKWQIIAFYL